MRRVRRAIKGRKSLRAQRSNLPRNAVGCLPTWEAVPLSGSIGGCDVPRRGDSVFAPVTLLMVRLAMQLASTAESLARTRSTVDRLHHPGATLPCLGTRFATSARLAPTMASFWPIVLFRAMISVEDGLFLDPAASVDVAPASDPLRHRIGLPAANLAQRGQSRPSFASCSTLANIPGACN